MEADTDLSRVLRALGTTNLFSAAEADLSGISARKPLFLSAALHRAGVIVDEKGTEAWAATGTFVSLGETPRPTSQKVFRADHPFLFFILERSQRVILFMGRIEVPKEQPAR